MSGTGAVAATAVQRENSATPLLEVRHLAHRYAVSTGLLGMGKGAVRAVDDVSFTVHEGQTFGLVGESGCGKSTTARLILRIESPEPGSVFFMGQDIARLRGAELKRYRRQVQAVFQDPYGALNPRMRIASIIAEPLEAQGAGDAAFIRTRVYTALERVGLPASYAGYLPHQLSGGQRQRVAIARALAPEPKLIVLDEPVSALDVSIRSQIINLLRDIQRETDVSYIMIAHDLASVVNLSDEIGVMYLGQLMELGPPAAFVDTPSHPYSQALFLSSRFDARAGKRWTPPIDGELPSPLTPPSGCPFHPRCPRAMDVCRAERPRWQPIGEDHFTACYLFNDETKKAVPDA